MISLQPASSVASSKPRAVSHYNAPARPFVPFHYAKREALRVQIAASIARIQAKQDRSESPFILG